MVAAVVVAAVVAAVAGEAISEEGFLAGIVLETAIMCFMAAEQQFCKSMKRR